MDITSENIPTFLNMNKKSSVVQKALQIIKVYDALNATLGVAMKVPHFKCLVEFQGVFEQNVSRSLRYLINLMKNLK